VGKRFWIKLTDELLNSRMIKRLEKQPNGHDFVLLLIHLLFDTNDTGGVLLVDMGGDIWQPMDAESIHDEHPSFSVEFIEDTIAKLIDMGLMRFRDDGFIEFVNYDELINTKAAAKQQRYRDRLKASNENR